MHGLKLNNPGDNYVQMVLDWFYTVFDHNLLFLHREIVLNTINSSIFVYTCVRNFAHNLSYVQNLFIQILALLFIILTILLCRIVYLL